MENNAEHDRSYEMFCFTPVKGDVLLKLQDKNNQSRNNFAWRMIVTDHKIKKVWPKEDDSNCSHENVLWAIDSKVRLISLCEDCGEFCFGQKTEDAYE